MGQEVVVRWRRQIIHGLRRLNAFEVLFRQLHQVFPIDKFVN
jgi:hypothetical protein